MMAETNPGGIILFRMALVAGVLFGVFVSLRFNRDNCRDTFVFGRQLDQATRRTIMLVVFLGMTALMFFAPGIGLLLFAVFGFNAIAREMMRSLAASAKDYEAASTVGGKISSAFGWRRSARIASGAEPLEFGFGMLVLLSAMLGIFLSVALGAFKFG